MIATEDILAAIRAAPDDDEPRLVYADALQAAGDPRGELIAVSCALARGGLAFDEAARLRRREHELLTGPARPSLGPLLSAHATAIELRRGFVESITIAAEEFLRHREALFHAAPCLRSLRLHPLGGWSHGYGYDEGDTAPILDPIAAVLEDPRIDGLAVPQATVSWMDGEMCLRPGSRSAADNVLALLCETGHIARLRELELGEETWALGQLARAERLDSLTLAGDIEARSLTATGRLRPRRLHLRTSASVGPSNLEAALDDLAKAPLVERVDELGLTRLVHGVGTRELPLLQTPLAPRLRSLASALDMTADECARIADAPELAKLEQLELSASVDGQPLGRQAKQEGLVAIDLEPLAHARRLDSLRVLRLSNCMTTTSAKQLLTSPLARRLELIDLRNNRPFGISVQPLADRLPGLVLLPPSKPKPKPRPKRTKPR